MAAAFNFTPLKMIMFVSAVGLTYPACTPKYMGDGCCSVQSRPRGCLSNQNSIDKTVGVWESQYVAMPNDREVWIDFGSDGRVHGVSATLDEYLRKQPVPAAWQIISGTDALFRYTKDVNVFQCPSRANTVGPEELNRRPETEYRWISSNRPIPELSRPGSTNTRKRGTICLHHRNTGEDGTTDSAHRP